MVQKIYPNYAPGDFTKWSFHNMRLGEVFRPYLLEVLAVSKRLFHSRLGNVQMTCKKVCSQKRKGLHHDQGCRSQGRGGAEGAPRPPIFLADHLTYSNRGGGGAHNEHYITTYFPRIFRSFYGPAI